MADVLFNTVKRLQGNTPWGDVLDAGTGLHSLRWLTACTTRTVTAVTGDPSRERALREQLGAALRPVDRILTANWSSPSTLAGEAFDVVLADYLLGEGPLWMPIVRLPKPVAHDGVPPLMLTVMAAT